MKSLFLLVVLVSLAGVRANAVYTDLSGGNIVLEVGQPGPGDMPIDMYPVSLGPTSFPFATTQQKTYDIWTRISAIQVTEMGEPQHGTVSLVNFGTHFHSIRYANTPPNGYNYFVVIWGHRGPNWSVSTSTEEIRMPAQQ